MQTLTCISTLYYSISECVPPFLSLCFTSTTNSPPLFSLLVLLYRRRWSNVIITGTCHTWICHVGNLFRLRASVPVKHAGLIPSIKCLVPLIKPTHIHKSETYVWIYAVYVNSQLLLCDCSMVLPIMRSHYECVQNNKFQS